MTDTSSVGTAFGTAKPESNKDNNQSTRQSTTDFLRRTLKPVFEAPLVLPKPSEVFVQQKQKKGEAKGDQKKSPEQKKSSSQSFSSVVKPIKAETKTKAQIQSNSTAQEPDRGDAQIIPHDYHLTAIMGAVALLLANVSKQETLTTDMFQFISDCYHLARWSEITNLAAGVLILRWIKNGHKLHESNWRHLLLVALMVAQKIMDDIPLRNGQCCVIWESVKNDSSQLTLAAVNELEAAFLKDIKYQAFVNSRTLISVYHELSDLLRDVKFEVDE